MSLQTFIRLRDLEKITGLKRSSIYERIAAGQFPKPVHLGPKSVAWLESEVIEWQAQRIAERDREAAA